LENKHKVVIVGGGFGGLYAARALKRAPVSINLLDRHNYHLFQPLLYQVATGFLTPADVASPLRAELSRQKNVQVLMAKITDIDVDRRQVITPGCQFPYDSLILAAGASHSYFGHDEWEAYAPGLKSVEDALDVRHRIFLAFENAEITDDADEREKWLTFVIVGGGPTGVEVAGALGETVRYTLRTDFRAIQNDEVRILLMEAGDRLLPAYSPDLSASSARSLKKLGVSVYTNHMVTEIKYHRVEVRMEEKTKRIEAGTILWAAGVQASPLGRILHEQTGVKIDKVGRLIVKPDLSLEGYPEIFVIGDLANFSHQTGKPLPGMAQPAMQEGAYVADLIEQRLQGKSLPPFHYRDKGQLATIGRTDAIADLGKIKVTGFRAKLIWIFVHLWYITEFENKILIFLQWFWNFITMNQRARIIFDSSPPDTSQPKEMEERHRDEEPIRQ